MPGIVMDKIKACVSGNGTLSWEQRFAAIKIGLYQDGQMGML